jgi:hypothetical protein
MTVRFSGQYVARCGILPIQMGVAPDNAARCPLHHVRISGQDADALDNARGAAF